MREGTGEGEGEGKGEQEMYLGRSNGRTISSTACEASIFDPGLELFIPGICSYDIYDTDYEFFSCFVDCYH